MATIYKHGGEVGRIEKLSHTILFCVDGKILRNSGSGWKLWRKLKPGIEPRDYFERCKAEYAEKLAGPAFSNWRELIHDFPPDKRFLVVEAVKLLAHDPDGLWSELDDLRLHVTLDEALELCCAYRAAREEAKEHNES